MCVPGYFPALFYGCVPVCVPGCFPALFYGCVPVCVPAHYFGPAPVGDMSASCYLYLQFTVFSIVPS